MADNGHSTLVEEYEIWHTPVIGAYILWEFTNSYQKTHKEKRGPIVLLHFLAGAILTDPVLMPILKRKTSLAQYVRHLRTGQGVLAYHRLHDRVRERMEWTMLAIDIAVAGGYLTWDVDTATLKAKSVRSRGDSASKRGERILEQAERAKALGRFFAKIEISKIAELLGVVF